MTDSVLEYRQAEEQEAYKETAEAKALQNLANIKNFDIPELITNLYHVDGRYIREGFTLEGTHPKFDDIIKPSEPRIKSVTIAMLQTLTMQDVREGDVIYRVRRDLIEHIDRALESPEIEKYNYGTGDFPNLKGMEKLETEF